MEYVTLTSSESSHPVPWRVDFTVTNLRQDLTFAIWMICDIDFGDNVTEQHTIFLYTTYVISHTYTIDVPETLPVFFCANHISNISHAPTVILRENVTQLTIVSNEPAVQTTEAAHFTVTMDTGSHVILELDYMDGSEVQNVTNSSIYSSTFDWSVAHVYTTPGNYTVQVTAYNEYYSAVAQLQVPVIIQAAVPALGFAPDDRSVRQSIPVP